MLKNSVNIDWITGILVGCFGIAALTKTLYPVRFQEYIKLPLTNKYFFIFGKNDPIYHPFNVLLFIVQMALASLLILLLYIWKNPSISSSNALFLYSKLFLGLSLFFVIKILLEKSVGIIFNIAPLIDRYVHQKLSYRNLMSIILMVTLLILVYITSFSIYIFYAVVGVLGTLNGIALFSSYKEQRTLILRHFFYFILYLCALEISPYILMYKVVL